MITRILQQGSEDLAAALANAMPGRMIRKEIGLLVDATVSQMELCRIFLTIEYRRTFFVVVLFFEDESFCLRVYEFLKAGSGVVSGRSLN